MLRVAAHDYIALNERDFTISMAGRDGNNKWWRLSQHINNIQLLTQCWKKRANTYTHINTPMSVIYHRTLMPFLFYPMLYVWTHLLLSQFQDFLWTSHHWMPIGKKSSESKSSRRIWRVKIHLLWIVKTNISWTLKPPIVFVMKHLFEKRQMD